MSSDESTEIIGQIYEAAEQPLSWSGFLRLAGSEFGSTVNLFTLNDNSSLLSSVTFSDGVDLEWTQEYNKYYYSTNILFERLAPRMLPGRIVSSDEACSSTELLDTEYYQDFLRHRDVFHLMGGAVAADSKFTAVLTLARSRSRGPWSTKEKSRVASLVPHLQRAVRLSGHFALYQQERDNVLNRLPMGVILLCESGKILYLNAAAESILRKKDGLCAELGAISAVDSIQASRLKKLISAAMLTASNKGTAGGGTQAITRLSGRPLSVLIAPMMPTAASLLSQSPRVALFITDPDAVQPTNLEHLTSLFGLTPAESGIADQLLQGKSLEEAACQPGVALQTARTQLKRIFGKTYTNRQSELMRLLLASPVSLRR